MKIKMLTKLKEEEVNLLEVGQLVYDSNGLRIVIDDIFRNTKLGFMIQDKNGNLYFADDLYKLICIG